MKESLGFTLFNALVVLITVLSVIALGDMLWARLEILVPNLSIWHLLWALGVGAGVSWALTGWLKWHPRRDLFGVTMIAVAGTVGLLLAEALLRKVFGPNVLDLLFEATGLGVNPREGSAPGGLRITVLALSGTLLGVGIAHAWTGVSIDRRGN